MKLSDGGQLLYKRLLLTTGARTRQLSVPITVGSRRATLRTYADALAICRMIGQECEVVVVGGGLIGLEVAASAVLRGTLVTVVEAGPRLLTRAVPAPMAELIKAKYERSSVRIQTGVTVERIDVDKGAALQSNIRVHDRRAGPCFLSNRRKRVSPWRGLRCRVYNTVRPGLPNTVCSSNSTDFCTCTRLARSMLNSSDVPSC